MFSTPGQLYAMCLLSSDLTTSSFSLVKEVCGPHRKEVPGFSVVAQLKEMVCAFLWEHVGYPEHMGLCEQCGG